MGQQINKTITVKQEKYAGITTKDKQVQYEIIKDIDTGASAHVKLAKDTYKDEIVALKLFLSKKISDKYLLREARTLSLLNHENIIKLVDIKPNG